MDGHRRYADEPDEPTWYPGRQSQPSQPSPYDSGAFRLPSPDPVTSTGSHARPVVEPPAARSSIRGPEYPAIRPTSTPSLPDVPAARGPVGPPPGQGYNDPTSLVPPVPAPERGRESVYSTRRPASAVVVAIVTAVLMVPVVRLLFQAAFAHTALAGSIVPAVLLTLGLPLIGVGLYALASGGRPHNRDTWLRPPVAYLPTGLLLVLAAAIAVG